MAAGATTARSAEIRLLQAVVFVVHSHEFPGPGYARKLADRDIKSSRAPKFSFSIRPEVRSSTLSLYVREVVTDAERLWLEVTATKSERQEGTDPSSWPAPELCFKTFDQMTHGEDLDLESISGLSRQHSVQVTLNVFAPLPGPAPGGLMRGLQKARLEGGYPECDATLCVAGTELPAHRIVLAAYSSVFSDMFGADCQESSDGRVDISDFPEEVVKRFVDYLYTEVVGDWAGLELELLRMADKYFVQPLKEDCELRLWQMDWRSALSLLMDDVVNPLISSALRQRCILVVANDLAAARTSAEWRKLQRTQVRVADAIKVCSASGPGAVQWPGDE